MSKSGRISGAEIGSEFTNELTPIPAKIRIYVDSFRSQLIARHLWDVGQLALNDHLQNEVSEGQISQETAAQIWEDSTTELTPQNLALVLGYALARLELKVVNTLEKFAASNGAEVVPNSLLVNQSNPMTVKVGESQGNILEILSLLKAKGAGASAKSFLDVSCDGIVFAPAKVDRAAEISKLQRLSRRSQRGDAQFIEANLQSIPHGIFQPRSNREPMDFGFSETFVDEVAQHVGSFSRFGKYNVYWGYGAGLREKGVDCDLVMKVMDDLNGGEIEAFVFVTHDGDFAPLLRRLVDEGKPVFVGGLRSEDRGHVSNQLLESIDKDCFFDLGQSDFASFVANMFMTGAEPNTMQMLMQWDQLA